MYRIREVDGDEEDETLAELHRAAFTDGTVVAEFTDGYWWIAYHGDEPVAFIGIRSSILGSDVGYFIRVGVTPEHRGHNLQRRLMRAMEQKAKKVGWTYIVTDTRNNPPSANNIISAGYRMFLPDDPWSFADAQYWTKSL